MTARWFAGRRTAEGARKVRMGHEWEGGAATIASAAPTFSQGVVYCAPDPSAFTPPTDGPRIQMSIHAAATGQFRPVVDARVAVVVPWPLSSDTAVPQGARPVPAASVANEFRLDM